VIFPVLIGALLWGGLVLRDPGLAGLLPIRRDRRRARVPTTAD
jgi:hypothetical protein